MNFFYKSVLTLLAHCNQAWGRELKLLRKHWPLQLGNAFPKTFCFFCTFLFLTWLEKWVSMRYEASLSKSSSSQTPLDEPQSEPKRLFVPQILSLYISRISISLFSSCSIFHNWNPVISNLRTTITGSQMRFSPCNFDVYTKKMKWNLYFCWPQIGGGDL